MRSKAEIHSGPFFWRVDKRGDDHLFQRGIPGSCLALCDLNRLNSVLYGSLFGYGGLSARLGVDTMGFFIRFDVKI